MSKFTPDEVEKFSQLGRKLAEKVVIDLIVLHYTSGDRMGKHTEMVRQLNAARKNNTTHHMSIEFDEIKAGHKLILQLSLVPNTYRTNVEIPRDYYNDFVSQANLLLTSANSMWRELKTMPFGDNLPAELNYDPSLQTLYINADDHKRIGVIAYYVDDKGRMLVKR